MSLTCKTRISKIHHSKKTKFIAHPNFSNKIHKVSKFKLFLQLSTNKKVFQSQLTSKLTCHINIKSN